MAIFGNGNEKLRNKAHASYEKDAEEEKKKDKNRKIGGESRW